MSQADTLAKYIGSSQETGSQNQAPGTPAMVQGDRLSEISLGGPSTNFLPIISASNLQEPGLEDPEKNLQNFKPLPNSITEYIPELPLQMYNWFLKKEKFTIINETMVWKNGEVREVQKRVANAPPHFSEFARSIGTTEKRLKMWAKNYPEFAEAMEACKAIIKEFLVDNGLLGNYNGQFAQFVAKNLTDMKDKHINENHNLDLNKMLDKAEKSSSPFDFNSDE